MSRYLHHVRRLSSVDGGYRNRHSVKSQSNTSLTGNFNWTELAEASSREKSAAQQDIGVDADVWARGTATARRLPRSKEQKTQPHTEGGQSHTFSDSTERSSSQRLTDRPAVCFSNARFANE